MLPIYDRLMQAGSGTMVPAFDRHVVASIFAIAWQESLDSETGFCNAVGLCPAEVEQLSGRLFGGQQDSLPSMARDKPLIDAEEQSLRDLLWMYASSGSGLQRVLANMVARRCLRPNHLWQDLGLRNRGELSQLMQTHFAGLARRNSGDMKWKKFLYRMVCREDGFSICASPICSACDDYGLCFGDEDGVALIQLVGGTKPANLPAPGI